MGHKPQFFIFVKSRVTKGLEIAILTLVGSEELVAMSLDLFPSVLRDRNSLCNNYFLSSKETSVFNL